jgi:hypothetical protein
MNVIVHNKKEVIMTETIITPEQAFKSKANFSSYIEKYSNRIIEEALDGYPQHLLHIIYSQLTPSADGLMEAVSNLVDNQKAYIFYFVANEKEEVFKVIKLLNQNFTNYCGIFVFKAYLNGDKIDFKCLLKPEIKKRKPYVRNNNTPVKQIQKSYWEKYFEICDEIQSEMQVTPAPRHYQYLPMGKTGVQIMQTVNTQAKYIATEIMINNRQEIFNNLYEHKEEIESELGALDWQALDGKKSSRIRQVLNYDITDESCFDEAIRKHIELAENFKSTFRKYL